MTKKILCLYTAWVLSCLATLGSFYLGEVHHITPCSLCWYQRLSIFPLVIFLGVAIYKNFFSYFHYVIAFPSLGVLFSSLHIAIQEIPNFHPKICSAFISCEAKPISLFGVISAPMLTLAVSLCLILLLCLGKESSRHKKSSV